MKHLSKFRRISRILFCVALFSSIGGHWVIFQSMAWANMFWNSTHTSPVLTAQVIREAAANTMDGKHPCHICKKIGVAKSEEKKKSATLSFKINFFPRPILIQLSILPPYEGQPIVMNDKEGSLNLRMSPPTKPPQRA